MDRLGNRTSTDEVYQESWWANKGEGNEPSLCGYSGFPVFINVLQFIHNAMTTATKLQHKTSDQHIELSISRCKRDVEDLSKIQMWFDQHEPFNRMRVDFALCHQA